MRYTNWTAMSISQSLEQKKCPMVCITHLV